MRYDLQVQTPGGSIFPIAGDYQTRYDDWEAADLQAATLSKLEALPIRVWGGHVKPIRKQDEAFSVVLVNVPTWSVWGVYADGRSL